MVGPAVPAGCSATIPIAVANPRRVGGPAPRDPFGARVAARRAWVPQGPVATARRVWVELDP
eukprot:3273074-Lingulodinium_polyedra.AAC.1